LSFIHSPQATPKVSLFDHSREDFGD